MKTSFSGWMRIVGAALVLSQSLAWAQTRGLPSDSQTVLSVKGNLRPNESYNPFSLASAIEERMNTRTQSLTLQTLEQLPQHQFTTMTPWSDHAIQFSGPLLRDVLAMAGVQGKNIVATAINDYRISIPMHDVQQFDVIVATRMNGQRMSVRDKGPLFVVYPFDKHPTLKQSRYYERSIWQLKSLEVE